MDINEKNDIPAEAGSGTPDGPSGRPEEEISMEELMKSEGEAHQKIYSRDIVKVKVVQVAKDHVLVDIGEKKEAVIPVADFQDEKLPAIGDEVSAVFERKGGEHTVLSHRKAREKAAVEWAKRMFEAKERVKARVSGVVKGGYIVDLAGLRAFMPLSLSELGGAHRHYLPVSAKIRCYITDFSEKDRRIVVSRRQVLEEEEKVRRTEVMGEVVPGAALRAVVSRVAADGLFVKFQGIEGFVPLSEVDWKSPAEALKSYKRGQRVRCRVLSVDKTSEKLTFGIKQLIPNPADVLKRRFPYRSLLKGTVVSVSEAGARVKVAGQYDGFVPAEEYGSHDALKEGQEIKGLLVAVNGSTYELVLSVKKSEEMEDRKKIQQYTKGAPALTLGQILLENSEDEGEM